MRYRTHNQSFDLNSQVLVVLHCKMVEKPKYRTTSRDPEFEHSVALHVGDGDGIAQLPLNVGSCGLTEIDAELVSASSPGFPAQ